MRDRLQFLTSIILSALLLDAWLILNPAISIFTSVKILVLVGIWSAPFLIAIYQITQKTTLSTIACAAGLGVGFSGLLSIISIAIGFPEFSTEMASVILAACLAASFYRINRVSRLVSADAPAFPALFPLIGFIAFLFPAIYFLTNAWLGGRGAFPTAVLSGDIGWDLSLVQSLIAVRQVPPPLLMHSGATIAYHYGALEAAAHLARLVGVPAHVALLYVVIPIFSLATIGGGWLIAGRISKTGIAFVAACFIISIVAFQMQNLLSARFNIIEAFGSWLTGRAPAGPPYVRIGPIHATSSGGIALTMIVVMLATYWESRLARYLCAFTIAAMAGIDAFSFASCGLILGLYSLDSCSREKSLRPIGLPAFSLLVGVLLLLANGVSHGSYSIKFGFFSAPIIYDYSLETIQSSWRLIALAVLAIGTCPNADGRKLLLSLLGSVAILFLISVSFVPRYGGEMVPDLNWFRWTYPIPLLLGLAAAFAFDMIRSSGRRLIFYAATLLVVLAAPLQLVRYASAAVQTAAAPGRSGDTKNSAVDTASLAEALRHIPVAGSLIVLSNLNWPNVEAPETNMLPSAIYGHKLYFSNWYPPMKAIPGAIERREETSLLGKENWDNAIPKLAQKEGWTHLLVRRSQPHPKDIPLNLLFENADYQVYSFEK